MGINVKVKIGDKILLAHVGVHENFVEIGSEWLWLDEDSGVNSDMGSVQLDKETALKFSKFLIKNLEGIK